MALGGESYNEELSGCLLNFFRLWPYKKKFKHHGLHLINVLFPSSLFLDIRETEYLIRFLFPRIIQPVVVNVQIVLQTTQCRASVNGIWNVKFM